MNSRLGFYLFDFYFFVFVFVFTLFYFLFLLFLILDLDKECDLMSHMMVIQVTKHDRSMTFVIEWLYIL